MAMDERDRIDVIVTLHDRFNKTADEIIRKMERMEDQAGETGDAVDDLEESLSKETRTTRDGSKALDENSKARDRNTDAVGDQGKALAQSTRHVRANVDSVRDSLTPIQKDTEAREEAAKVTTTQGKALGDAREALGRANEATKDSTRLIDVNKRSVNQARDAMGRFTKTTGKSTETLRKNTEEMERSRDERGRYTKATEKDTKAWTKWDTKVKKITGSIGSRFRPVGAFFQNYFKILGAFRAMLFSDIGAMIPQLITGIVAIGSAANATLGPLGRLVGNLGQIAPLIAAFAQTKVVFGFVKKGVGDALKVLNDTNATLEDLNKAQAELGDNTWETAKALKQIGEEFDPIKKAVRETFLEGMAPALTDLTNTYFPLFRDELTRTAEIMNGELREGMKGLQTPEKQDTIADVMERSSIASGLFVDIAWSLLDVFIELADAAGPAFLDTLESVDEILDRFAGWIRDNKDGLTDFFNRANDTAGNFFKGIGYIALGLYGISKAAKPLEDFLYGGLLDRLQGWSEAMNDPEAQAEMTERYEAMIPNLEAIGNLIGAILDGFKTVGESEYFAPLINDLADNTIPLIFEYIKKLDETVGPPLMRIGDALSEMDPGVLTSVLNPLGDLLGGLAWVLETVVPLFSALPDPVQKFVMYGAGLVSMGLPGFFVLLIGALKFLAPLWKGLVWIVQKFAGLIVDIAESKFGKRLGAMFKPIIEFAKKWGGKFVKLLGPVAKFLGKKSFAVIPVVGTVIAILWTLWDVISWLWKNVEPFRNFMTGIWDWIVEAWNASIDWIVNTAVPWVVGAFQAIWDKMLEFGQAIADFYNRWIKPGVDGIIWLGKVIFVTVTTIAIIIGKVIGFIWNKILSPFLKWVGEKLVAGIKVQFEILGEVFKILWGGIKWVWDLIVTAAKGLWSGIKWVIDRMVAGFLYTWDQILWVVDAIVWGFNWVRDGIAAAWAWIKDHIITPVVNWFLTWVVPIIMNVVNALVGAFIVYRDKVIAVWAWIKDHIIGPFVSWFRDTIWPIFRNILTWIGDKFDWLRDKATTAWGKIKDFLTTVYDNSIKPVFDKFGELLNNLENSFRVARDSIGLIWEGLKEKVSGPVKYVVDVVYNNGIRKVWNEVADAVDLDTTLPEVTFGRGSSGSGASSGRGGSRAVMSLHTGGYTGPGSKYQPAGVVHADEFVIKKESQRSLRRDAPGLLDALNNYGSRALGYSTGGQVKNYQSNVTINRGYDSGGWVKPFQGNYSINSGYGRRGGRLHAGVDFPTPTGTALTAVSSGSVVGRTSGGPAGNKISLSTDMAGIVAGYHHLSRFAASLGQTVAKGQVIGYSGNTGRSTGPHLHFSIKKDGRYVDPTPYLNGAGSAGTGAGGGFMWNPFEGMIEKFTNHLKQKFPEAGRFVDVGVGTVEKLVGGARDFVLDKMNFLSGATDAVGDTLGDVMGAIGTSRWRGTATRALQHTGDFSDANLSALLRRMNQESGGNPNAINNWDSNAKKGTPSKGLMQVIDPTFRAYRDPSLSANIYDPMANIVASIRYAKSRYGSLTAAYNRAGGYSGGGLVVDHMKFMGGPVDTWGNTLVGEFGPEIFLPASGSAPSLLGLMGPEVVSFDREGSILPHQAVAALSTVGDAPAQQMSTETNHYSIDIKVGSDATEIDVERAVKAAIRDIERKKKERR